MRLPKHETDNPSCHFPIKGTPIIVISPELDFIPDGITWDKDNAG
ncbi:MAG: hypothetical protein ACU84H_06305 [Gammaproteobacteria bacterium]